MARNNRNKKTSNKKYNQRRDNLVGLKQQPVPRNKRERQIQELTKDMQNFEKVRKCVAHKARQRLGYDFEHEYMTNKKLALGDIVIKNEKHPQCFSIPMDPKTVKRFVDAPKYVIKTVSSIIKGEKYYHEKTQHICMAVLDEGPVLFDFYNHLKYPYGKFSEDNFNIGLFALLQGSDYFHINRYDSLSLQGHTRVFDDQGNIIMKFISKDACKNKPHSHSYDQRFAVLFSGKEHVGHEDRKEEQKYSSYETAIRAWKKKLNIVELKRTFSDDMTIGEIYDQLKIIEEEKKGGKLQGGKEKWNCKNYQSK